MIISNKKVKGIGTKGMVYPSRKDRQILDEYAVWQDMLWRCAPEFLLLRPTYTGTTCSENFAYYPYFYEWCNKQKGFNNVDENGKKWNLDKDILLKGNRLYHEDLCVFVPARINMLFVKSNKTRGDCPLGVHWDSGRGKFKAACSIGKNKGKFLGRFKSKEEAFQVYKTFKEALIKEVANEYKEQLDYRAYMALMNYQVEVTD